MKKVVCALAVSAILAFGGAPREAAGAKPWRVGGNASYSSMSFKDLKWSLEDFLAAKGEGFLGYLYYTGSDGYAAYSLEYPRGALSLEAELFYMFAERVGAGARAGYFFVPSFNGTVYGTGVYGEVMDYSIEISSSLIPVLFGIHVEPRMEPGGVGLGGRIMAGPVFASADVRQQQYFYDPYWPSFSMDATWLGNYSVSGEAIAFEICGNLIYGIDDNAHMFLELAYRGARFSSMKIENNLDLDDDGIYETRRGDKFTDKDGKAVPWDFGGIKFAVGVRLLM